MRAQLPDEFNQEWVTAVLDKPDVKGAISLYVTRQIPLKTAVNNRLRHFSKNGNVFIRDLIKGLSECARLKQKTNMCDMVEFSLGHFGYPKSLVAFDCDEVLPNQIKHGLANGCC